MSVPAQEQLRKHDHFMMLSLTYLAQCKIFMTFDLLADYLQFIHLLRNSDFYCFVFHWSTCLQLLRRFLEVSVFRLLGAFPNVKAKSKVTDANTKPVSLATNV